jgi:hypothetical protein
LLDFVIANLYVNAPLMIDHRILHPRIYLMLTSELRSLFNDQVLDSARTAVMQL